MMFHVNKISLFFFFSDCEIDKRGLTVIIVSKKQIKLSFLIGKKVNIMSMILSILGILLILLGVCCAFTPLTAFMATGYFIAFVLISAGVAGIITSIYYKIFGWNLIISILAAALGALAVTRPGGIEAIDNMLAYLLAFWFILRGCISVYLSLKLKKLRVSANWILGLIIGVLGIALGVYSLIHPVVPAMTIGLLIALCFIEQGLDVITMGRVARSFGK